MRSHIMAATLACAALAVAGASASAKPGNSNGASLGEAKAKGRGAVPDAGFGNPWGPNYGVNGCPPGLARKHNGCLPPGQAKKLFERGQRVPRGFGFYTPLDDIPLNYRNRIPGAYLGGNYDYIYRGDSIYVVDPTTRLVADIVSLLL